MAWSDFPNQQSNSAPKTWASMLIKSQSTIWKHPIKSSNLQVWWFYWMFSQLYKNDYWKKESGSSETNYRVLLWLTCFGGLWVFVAPFSVINICSNHGPNVSFSIYPQFVHRVSLDASLKFILLEDNGSFICNEEFPQKVPLLFWLLRNSISFWLSSDRYDVKNNFIRVSTDHISYYNII